jgi:tetratricopeptide (TPR) repeat protein
VGTALLVEFYEQMPERRTGESATEWRRRRMEGVDTFRRQAQERYSEGTLLRLLESPDVRARRAALSALEMYGTFEANAAVAARLHDGDAEVRRLTVDALWAIWFRGGSEEHIKELRRLVRLRNRTEAMAGLDALAEKAPRFAEVYNQRAILYFKDRQYERSAVDCERVLNLNPFHFGAQAGMAQCLLHLRKHRAALKAFRQALRINPHLEGIEDAIRALENALGEEGRRDDKK